MSIAIFRASAGLRAPPPTRRSASVSPSNILQDEVVDAVLMSDVEQRADVRMIQRRDGARLAVEAVAQLRVGGELRGEGS